MNSSLSDWVQILSTLFAALAAMTSALSSWLSLRATKAVEEEARLAQSVTKFQLVAGLEADYRSQYPQLRHNLVTPAEKALVDPDLRKTVHDLLQSLTSVYLAGNLELLDGKTQNYLVVLYLDWLNYPPAREVWWNFFRTQSEVWPTGFISFVDQRLGPPPSVSP